MTSSKFKAGLAMRKKVLGAEYVEKSLKSADEFFMPFQELVTEFAWGSLWTRPGLPPKIRSMLVLAFCIALNRPNELKLHLKGALRNGCTKTEIREILLQSFGYCGAPASLEAFHVARGVFAELAATQTSKKPARKAAKKRAR